MNYLNWKPTEQAIQVETAYEISNGLPGMLRCVVLRLLGVTDKRKDLKQREKDNIIRSVIGMCAESRTWKAAMWFFGGRTMDITGEVAEEWQLVLTVRRTATVAEVKRLVEEKTGIKAADQKLYLGRAINLENTRTLPYYHIVNGTFITIEASLGRKIRIYIATLLTQNFYLNVHEKEPVENVKRKIQSKTGIPAGSLRLIFAGRVLKDGTVVGEYGMANEATINIIVPHHSAKYFDE